jgi:hypothetical protein
MNKHMQHKQQGSALVIALGIFVVVMLIIVAFAISTKHRRAANTQNTTTTPSQKSNTPKSSSPTNKTTPQNSDNTVVNDPAAQKRDDLNAQRKADAVATASGVKQFLDANIGDWPDHYADSDLLGAEGDAYIEVDLKYYSDIAFVSGAQDPDTYDTLTVVSSATCAINGSTVDSDSATGLAVQYSIMQSSGDFAGGCINI